MTAEEECALAQDIIAAEQAAHALVATHPVARPILSARASRKERTRAGAVERLEAAVEQCAAGTAAASPPVLEARRLLHAAAQLRWRLAMSARSVAHAEARKLACVLMDVEDLRQHGYIGLLSAARRFEPDRGIRFATYARWWVRAHMTRALENTGRTVRLPGGAVEQLRNLRAARARMEQAGASPDLGTLAAEVGLDADRARMLLSRGGVVSLDQETRDGARIQDYLASSGPEDAPDQALIRLQELDRMFAAFDVLSSRERYILTHHYGLDNVESRSMSSIGASIGISRERVRQIEVGALQRLRKVI